MSSQARDLSGPIHFFQIIGENSLRNGELRIPRSFVSKHWRGISNPVFLVVPNGAKWKMNWEKRDVDVWLSNGWKKFADFYSLYKDQFLLFKYEGKSQFEVRILHRSALEIDYPSLNGTFEGEESGNSIEILDDTSPRHSKRPKSPSPYSHSPKKKKINTKEPERYPSQHVETKGAQSRFTKLEKKKFYADSVNAWPKNRGRRGIFSKSEAINNEEALEDTESSSALQRAKAFISDNPWFYREMRPAYLQNNVLFKAGPYVTAQEQEENGCVILWVTEERNWNVEFRRNNCNGQIWLSTGWKKFVEDNNLKVGDVCVFEKTECRGVSFRVVIYRATEESTRPPSQAYGGGANRRKQTCVRNYFAERGFDGTPKECSKNSKHHRYNSKMSEDHFTITLKASHLKHTALIPYGFLKNYAHNAKCVTLRVGMRSWKVKLDSYPQYRYGRFTAGWHTFVRDCNLKAGDVCSFQLIDKENHVLEVEFQDASTDL